MFINDNFLLQSETAQRLYHDHAAGMPIIDYHCHLSPQLVASDHRFSSITELWLGGDHYKWRAMRWNGIDERRITGDASDWEKFQAWAETVPYTLRNPLYHWTHLELKTAFGIDTILTPETARGIFDRCNDLLQNHPDYTAQGLMRRYNVEVVCTTDDPADTLEHHIAMRNAHLKMLPTWRPDKAMAIEDPMAWRAYIHRLAAASDTDIHSYKTLLDALRKRHDFFASVGCRLSDHGVERFYAEHYTDAQIEGIFQKLMKASASLEGMEDEALMFKSAMMHDFAVMDAEKGWAQQLHYGPLRNNNTRMMRLLGPDTGFDSIGMVDTAADLARFLDRLDLEGALPKTIIYNINPADNEMVATMCGNYQDGSVPGKIQFGSGWWFLDQKDGITKQLNALSVLGLLSRFVGMLTDSRSFVSYPRHEYFRRILCNMLAEDIERGELPVESMPRIGQMVEDICYNNAKRYFDF